MAKSKTGKIGLIVCGAVSLFLAALLIVVNVLGLGKYNQLFDLYLGRGEAVYADGIIPMYPAVTSVSKQSALEQANAKNVEIAQEGFVLLKNEGEALPLEKGAKISVFGKNSVNLAYGGSGSGGFDSSSFRTLYDSLHEAGFKTNDKLESFYLNNSLSGSKREPNSSDLDSGGNQKIATAETPQSMYTDDVKQSYTDYNDAALVVITRIGGEGFDLPRYQGDTEGATNADDHYLQLDKNERDLLTAVCAAGFGHVVVIFNIPATFEAPFLKEEAFKKIDAALWIGFTGGQGIMALGNVLNGTVTPSGHLTDTWAANFKEDPTFVNFGTGPTPEYSDMYEDPSGKKREFYFVHYEESIYVGYRYYETRGLNDEEWYDANVVYPFGYGLSYTTFDWEIVNKPTDVVQLSKDGKVTVEVKVTNTGDYDGKEVVQLYCTLPYTNGSIEKAAKVLVGFGKTDLLKADGGQQTVTIEFDPYSVASYDYRDANENGFSGYELENGGYTLEVARNAHDVVDTVACNLAEDVFYDVDPVTEEAVENRYTDRSGVLDSDYDLSTKLSRANWSETWPNAPTAEDNKGEARIIEEITDLNHNNPTDYSSYDYPVFGDNATLAIRDLLPDETPKASYLPIVEYKDERWDMLLNACTESEILALYGYAAYQTREVASVGAPLTFAADGPAGFTCFMNKEDYFGTCNYCSEPVIAATWNEALIEEMGMALGEEAAWGNDAGTPYSCLYAPGANIHRSQFGGRNSEYFSEDPFLTGKIAAAEIRGLQSKGVNVMMKHFVANEQETHRSITGDCSWLTEQSLREIYLKPFEIAVKEADARGIMTSFNRIGTRWTGGDYRLITEILEIEWGFHGAVICDFNTIPDYMNSRQMAYAGGDLNLSVDPKDWFDSGEMGDPVILRKIAKDVLYTVVNSNAMNGEVLYYKTAPWRIILYVADGVIPVGIAVWAFFAVRKFLKGRRSFEK